MRYVKTYGGLEIPQVGLGLWQVEDPAEFEAAVESAVDLGYRHFDIAYTYKNEAKLGEVLKKCFTAGKVKREDMYISTKLPQIGMENSRVEHFLKLSLAALGLDYVDTYLIHFPVGFQYVNDHDTAPKGDDGQTLIDHQTDLKSIWEAMEKQVEAGRAKVIGLSNFNAAQVQRVWDFAKIKPSVLQVELNAYLQQPELVSLCKTLNIAVVGYGNLGSPGRKTFFEKIGRSTAELVCPEILTDPEVLAIAQKHSKVPAQILLRFLIQQDVICIPKTTLREQQMQNIEVFDFDLDESDMQNLRKLDQGEKARSFTMAFFKGAENHLEYPFHRNNVPAEAAPIVAENKEIVVPLTDEIVSRNENLEHAQ